MKTIRACLLSAAACGCLCSFANPVVTVDRVQQRYPWNGLVDIDYTIANFTGDEVDYQLAVDLVMTGATQRVYSFANYAPCDAPITNGTHRLTWNAPADGVERLERNASIIIRLVYAPTTERDADYLIIDVSGGTSAETYPVKFVKGGVPRQFNSVRYQSDRIVLKRVPAGSFWMGQGSKVNGNFTGNVSSPTSSRHYVTLTKDFFLGLFPVTQRQHELVMGSPCGGNAGVCSRGGTKPTYDWSWNTIMGAISGGGFFTNLCAKTVCRGLPIRGFTLPTEAQREYACRAGTTNSYVYASDSTDLLDYYAYHTGNMENWSKIPSGTYYYPLATAGSFLPNAWGFYGMQALVSEWCSDWYGEYPTSTEEEPDIDPTGPATGTQKVLRGGNCYSTSRAIQVNSGTRLANTPQSECDNGRHAVYGFRIMKYVP